MKAKRGTIKSLLNGGSGTMHTTFKLVAFVCLSITAFMLCTGCFEMTQELIPNKHRSVHYVVAPSSTPASFRSRQAAPAFTLAALERKIAPLSDFKDKVVEVEVALISTDADTGTPTYPFERERRQSEIYVANMDWTTRSPRDSVEAPGQSAVSSNDA